MPKAKRAKPSQADKGKAAAREGFHVTTVAILPSAASGLGSSAMESSPLPATTVLKLKTKLSGNSLYREQMAEAATLQRTNAVRQSMLLRNTVEQYLRYERHWVVCD
ncbi:hypothetical protein BG004_001748 [Podila humilis]|nr:hypothetical protein BG004_001748 [Podila humilis]